MKSEAKIKLLRGRPRSDLVGTVILGFIFGTESTYVILEGMLDN